MDHYTAKSKSNWGREEQKSPEELNRLCNEFFTKLSVPEGWKDMGWVNAPDGEVLLSVGKLFRDTRTSGIGLMHYRVFFNSFSQKGGVCSKTITDFGKYAYKSEIFNKTVEQLNKWIYDNYNEIKTNTSASVVDLQGDIANDDGLQHFRDRFGAGVANE